MQDQNLENCELLRRQDVEAMCKIGRATIYRLMREGKFPEPILIGPRAVRWPLREIQDWIAGRPRARGAAVTHDEV